MALSRILQKIQALPTGLVILSAKFTFAAGGDTASVSSGSKGFTAASLTDTAVGQFTLDFPGSGTLDLQNIQFSLEEPTQNLHVFLRSYTPSTRQAVFHIRTNGTEAVAPADWDPTTGAILRVFAVVKNSSVP